MAREGLLVAVTGTDGAGKSTVTRALAESLGPSALLVGKALRDVPGDETLSTRLRMLNELVFGAATDHGNEWGDHHWLFALASWYSLVDRCVVRPALAAGCDVVLDNEPNKVRARFLLDGDVPAEVVDAAFANLTVPDVTVLLDVQPSAALARKRRFTQVESGFRGTSDGAFMTRQERVRTKLFELATAHGWFVVDTTDRCADDVLRLVSERVRSARASIDAAGRAGLTDLHRTEPR